MPKSPLVPIDNLPASVLQIIDLVGLAPALALVQAFAGNVIKIPVNSGLGGHMRERLVMIMGGQAADQLIAAYGGERLAIARCVKAMRDARDRQIIDDYDRGHPVSALTAKYLLTDRQIRTILKRSPGESAIALAEGYRRQITLF